MKVRKFENHEETSLAVAEEIIAVLKAKPNATLVVTSGDTPTRAYELLLEKAPKGLFESAMLISLDEWVGIARSHVGGCSYMVDNSLFIPLRLSSANYTFFDATALDLIAECQRVDEIIASRGGLDFVLVGLGLNGHIGLNEPGTSFECYCTVTQLDPLTAEVGQKYFKENTILTNGITVGLKHMLEAKKVMIIATGYKKAPIVNKVVKSEPVESLPASFIHLHPNGFIFTDCEIV
jgi:6-phosphogluconolactonase/glucosamine-6-phosphate isomerase/deaminase